MKSLFLPSFFTPKFTYSKWEVSSFFDIQKELVSKITKIVFIKSCFVLAYPSFDVSWKKMKRIWKTTFSVHISIRLKRLDSWPLAVYTCNLHKTIWIFVINASHEDTTHCKELVVELISPPKFDQVESTDDTDSAIALHLLSYL